MTHTNLVASELTRSGYAVKVAKRQVIEVSLKNRKVDNMEVRYVLGQMFEDIDFDIQTTNNGVNVTV